MAEEAKNAGAEALPTKDIAEEKTAAPAVHSWRRR